MLLELITGRRPVDSTQTFMEDSLVDWVSYNFAYVGIQPQSHCKHQVHAFVSKLVHMSSNTHHVLKPLMLHEIMSVGTVG